MVVQNALDQEEKKADAALEQCEKKMTERREK